ncbi:hypothetical protein MMC25_004950 [Agyrium rufum]|nr:hypothetical protein [Agyrium rufum]
MDTPSIETSPITKWKSIITLIVFVITNFVVIFPFHISVYVPRPVSNAILDGLSTLRIIRRRYSSRVGSPGTTIDDDDHQNGKDKPFARFRFPLNFITAPLIADLFLLAIQAIGRQEVHDGTLGADNIIPIDIMAFFITLAYIAISIDASGLIRYLAFKVLQKAGKVGHRLFFYLYAFFFALGSFIGNDPIILSGTAFLAYMTRVSSNIVHPRAWIHTQFAVANIASAILVSSNPTNLVLAGAFNIKFIHYTANMIVPVLVTATVLFPFLLYIVFQDEDLIPFSITMHELSEEAKAKKPVNPNIPNARGKAAEEEEIHANDEQGKKLSLEEIMNPFLDKSGAVFGGAVMAVTLVTVLALNAANSEIGEHPVFWVTLPGAFVMFCWDITFGWLRRHETRQIAHNGRREVENARSERKRRQELLLVQNQEVPETAPTLSPGSVPVVSFDNQVEKATGMGGVQTSTSARIHGIADDTLKHNEKPQTNYEMQDRSGTTTNAGSDNSAEKLSIAKSDVEKGTPLNATSHQESEQQTLTSIAADTYRWLQETFPTVTAIVSHLPFALVPFAFSMFVLVQALVTKGWVAVFAYGWDHWVNKTGTIGAVGGMGFLSVILCNFAGTNIGTTILLSRVIQAWAEIHHRNLIPISDRTYWATIYSLALGVNYGAFSIAFSASLAGLLWRDILSRKHIRVGPLEFARVNLPIIAIAMTVGCAVLIGEVYLVRSTQPYK